MKSIKGIADDWIDGNEKRIKIHFVPKWQFANQNIYYVTETDTDDSDDGQWGTHYIRLSAYRKLEEKYNTSQALLVKYKVGKEKYFTINLTFQERLDAMVISLQKRIDLAVHNIIIATTDHKEIKIFCNETKTIKLTSGTLFDRLIQDKELMKYDCLVADGYPKDVKVNVNSQMQYKEYIER